MSYQFNKTGDEIQKILDDASSIEANAKKAEIAANKAQTATMHPPQIINKNWWMYDFDTGSYIDTGVTAQGKNGLPDRVVYTDVNYYKNVFNNTHCEAVFTDAYVSGTFQVDLYPFKDNSVLESPMLETATDTDPTKGSSITVSFNCVDGLTFALYAFSKDGSTASIVWSGAEPTFTPGYTYFLSFVPLSDTRILGAWSEVPTV